MQVNSAQDWLTKQKRRILARTYHTIPPPQSRRTNAEFMSVEANSATQRERFILPTVSAWGGVPGTARYTSECCLSNGNTAAPGVFATRTTQGIVRFNVIPPISVTATRPRVA